MAHRPCDCLLKGLIYVLLWIQSLLKAIIVRVSFGGGAFAPPLLEFACQYAHYDNPVCHLPRVFQIHILPPSMNF